MVGNFITLFAILVFSFSAKADNCADHDASNPNVPLCPENGGVLSEIYPARMALVSTEIGGSRFAANVAKELFSSQVSRPPVVVVTAPETDCKEVQEQVAMTAPPQFRDLWVANIKCNTGAKTWNWQQDFAQGYVRSDGTPYVRFNPQYYQNKGRGMYRGLKEQVEACGFQSEEKNMGETNAYMGGNIEGMPPDICVLGDNVPEQDRNKLCDNVDKVIAPTDYMAVGHVDEIMKTIKTNGPAPCNFKILVGSVDLGRSLMANQTDSSFIPRPNGQTSKICKAGLQEASLPLPPPGRSGTVTWKSILLGGPIHRSSAGALPLNPTGSTKSTPAQIIQCTPQEFLRGVSALYGELNDEISGKLNNFANELTNKMRAKNPRCGNVVERVPMLFHGTKGQDDSQSIFPNPSNSLSINRSIIYSDPNNKIYDDYLKTMSENMGLRKRNINTDRQHQNMGNLHCSTNLLRYCRPR